MLPTNNFELVSQKKKAASSPRSKSQSSKINVTSPPKVVTTTSSMKQYIDSVFGKQFVEVHPTIIPFLTVLIPDDEEEFLQPFAAAVNHNVVNESKTLQIIHTLMGNFCHGDKTKESQPEEMGNDACMMISYDAKVSMILD